MMFYLLTESFSYSFVDFFNTYGASAVYPALTQPGAQYDRRKNQTPKNQGTPSLWWERDSRQWEARGVQGVTPAGGLAHIPHCF